MKRKYADKKTIKYIKLLNKVNKNAAKRAAKAPTLLQLVQKADKDGTLEPMSNLGIDCLVKFIKALPRELLSKDKVK